MRGSIVRRKDRFSVVTDVPPGPDGKRRQKWHAGCPTGRETEQLSEVGRASNGNEVGV